MKNLKITVNGTSYDVQVEEIETSENSVNLKTLENSENIISKTAKIKNNANIKSEPVNSPMPGTIISISAKKGFKVSRGETLLVLEAMKMENEIVSPRDAVVEEIIVSKGQSVESGEALVLLK